VNRHLGVGAGVALGVMVADQTSKAWILSVLPQQAHPLELLPVLDLTLTWNRGITFGLFNGQDTISAVLLVAVALAVVAALVVWLRRAESPLVAAAIGAIAGGAIGNVVDRVRFGAVVDFIHAHIGDWQWYVFNVADAAIVCGVATLVLDGLRGRGVQRTTADPPGC
jgi:lipoprotein signal peptidase